MRRILVATSLVLASVIVMLSAVGMDRLPRVFAAGPPGAPARPGVKTDTTTTITNAVELATPTLVGQPYVVKWEVVPLGTGTPTGNVVVVIAGGGTCFAPVADAQCTVTPTVAALYTLTAAYLGDSNFNASPSSAPVQHTVNRGITSLAITNPSQLANSSVVGQPVTVIWAVGVISPASGIPTGAVNVAGGPVCTAPVALGYCVITPTIASVLTLTAYYTGDSNFTGSASEPVSHTVRPGTVSLSISNANELSHASIVGTNYTVEWSFNVVPPGGGNPTGSVRVSDGLIVCFASIGDGSCGLTPTQTGVVSLTAAYLGDGNYLPFTSPPVEHSVDWGLFLPSVTK